MNTERGAHPLWVLKGDAFGKKEPWGASETSSDLEG